MVRICRLGKSIPERFAYRYYDAVTVGIDFTARDWQREARTKGLPWEICKGFDGSAVIGEWVDKQKFRDIQAIHFHLDINGKMVQEGCTSDMLYKVDELVSYISQFFTLKTGDLLYTGTPVGVGPVHIDDHLEDGSKTVRCWNLTVSEHKTIHRKSDTPVVVSDDERTRVL